jgi:PAS domain S-box-containing protein
MTAIVLVAASIGVRLGLNPVLGGRFPYFLQFVTILFGARYVGFGPAVGGLALASTPPFYAALEGGRTQYWVALPVAWIICLFLIWLLDRQRHMLSEVATSSRLADERLKQLGIEKSQRELEEGYSAQLRAIVESSDDAIVSKNLAGVIQSWNQGAERIFGYTADEAIGKSMSLLVPPGRSHEESDIIDRIRNGGRVQHFETVRVRKDGRQIHVSLTSSPIRDNKGTVVGLSHVARDISANKELESQMHQAQKLESLGVLAGGLAHDFNNLLTGVLGNASLVQEDLDSDHPAQARVAEIIIASEQAALLVKQMLAYAGKGKFVVQQIDLSQHVAEIVPLIRASLSSGVRLELQLAANLPKIEADPSQMQQLLMNLAINAAEAVGQAAGVVTISTSSSEVDTELQVILEVKDTGIGMDEATKARIFDPFFTTKFTGRGLGLAAVMGIIRAHRGTITVESAQGKGRAFTVVLPASEGLETSEADEEMELRGDGLILVVDDEETVLNMARFSLEGFGYRVEAARDGQTAVALLAGHPYDFDTILLDLTMPVMTAEETLRTLQEIRANVPIVLSGVYSEPDAMKRFVTFGIAGFLQKPYTAIMLGRKIKQALHHRSKATR